MTIGKFDRGCWLLIICALVVLIEGKCGVLESWFHFHGKRHQEIRAIKDKENTAVISLSLANKVTVNTNGLLDKPEWPKPFDEKARWIVVCNFDEFRIHDRGNWVQPEGRGDFDDKPLRSSQGANFSTFGIKDFSSGCWSFHSTRGKVESFCRVAFRYPERDSNWMQPLRSHPLPVRY